MVIVPCLQLCYTLFGVISGLCYFREYEGMTLLQRIMFGLGVAVSDVSLWGATCSCQASEINRNWLACPVTRTQMWTLCSTTAMHWPLAPNLLQVVCLGAGMLAQGVPAKAGSDALPAAKHKNDLQGRTASASSMDIIQVVWHAEAGSGAAAQACLYPQVQLLAPSGSVDFGRTLLAKPEGRARALCQPSLLEV